jgi:hypothetical protein
MRTIVYNGKERNISPLLMKPELVAQTLLGVKTETRRLSGLDKVNENPDEWDFDGYLWDPVLSYPNYEDCSKSYEKKEKGLFAVFEDKLTFDQKIIKCPYGQVGDLIWIRETWSRTKNINDQEEWPGRPHMLLSNGDVVIYASDGQWQWLDDDGFTTERTFWKPNLHMPFAACRLFLEITDVGLERLQDITNEGSINEGVVRDGELWKDHTGGLPFKFPRQSFQSLWYSINGKESWAKNPWVWKIGYKRVDIDPKTATIKK